MTDDLKLLTREELDVFNDEGGERGETTLPDDLRAVLEDFVAQRSAPAGRRDGSNG